MSPRPSGEAQPAGDGAGSGAAGRAQRRAYRHAPSGRDGPLVGVCGGARCAGLRRLAPGPLDELADAVRATPGAVLLRADCPGACALGVVGVVARRDGATGRPGAPLWLSCLDRPALAAALVAWVRAGGPADGARPGADVPDALRAAVVSAPAPRPA
ncbi:hypothetical protein [Vallicoccus soli]|uniref:(2Fe-2S) ferredoxin domain-containing protein n=1 Tax=Vallicoccus soli TaxID=2339232 RepID=A0A3A3YV85_9ACTN|nr:hypothetical protein [Vallicoccus soli]RJK93774.1 hypothetical protein D5H78_15695 [Vallicoccus soli]